MHGLSIKQFIVLEDVSQIRCTDCEEKIEVKNAPCLSATGSASAAQKKSLEEE